MRPLLVAGGERTPVAFMTGPGLGFLLLGWNWHSIPAAVTGASILLIGLPVLRKIAAADPHMFAVYRRSIRYKSYYPARSTPLRRG